MNDQKKEKFATTTPGIEPMEMIAPSAIPRPVRQEHP